MVLNARILLFYCVLMSIHSFFIFPEMAGRGGYSPPSHPPKSTTGSLYQNQRCQIFFTFVYHPECLFHEKIKSSCRLLELEVSLQVSHSFFSCRVSDGIMRHVKNLLWLHQGNTGIFTYNYNIQLKFKHNSSKDIKKIN